MILHTGTDFLTIRPLNDDYIRYSNNWTTETEHFYLEMEDTIRKNMIAIFSKLRNKKIWVFIYKYKSDKQNHANYSRLELTWTFFENYWLTYSEYNNELNEILDIFNITSYKINRIDIRKDVEAETQQQIADLYTWSLSPYLDYYSKTWKLKWKYKETIYFWNKKSSKKIRIYSKQLDTMVKKKSNNSEYLNQISKNINNVVRVEYQYNSDMIQRLKYQNDIISLERHITNSLLKDFWFTDLRSHTLREKEWYNITLDTLETKLEFVQKQIWYLKSSEYKLIEQIENMKNCHYILRLAFNY